MVSAALSNVTRKDNRCLSDQRIIDMLDFNFRSVSLISLRLFGPLFI